MKLYAGPRCAQRVSLTHDRPVRLYMHGSCTEVHSSGARTEVRLVYCTNTKHDKTSQFMRLCNITGNPRSVTEA